MQVLCLLCTASDHATVHCPCTENFNVAHTRTRWFIRIPSQTGLCGCTAMTIHFETFVQCPRCVIVSGCDATLPCAAYFRPEPAWLSVPPSAFDLRTGGKAECGRAGGPRKTQFFGYRASTGRLGSGADPGWGQLQKRRGATPLAIPKNFT